MLQTSDEGVPAILPKRAWFRFPNRNT